MELKMSLLVFRAVEAFERSHCVTVHNNTRNLKVLYHNHIWNYRLINNIIWNFYICLQHLLTRIYANSKNTGTLSETCKRKQNYR
jgi:hypothetical protein